jgi:hypothetical protein
MIIFTDQKGGDVAVPCLGFEPTNSVFEGSKRSLVIRRTAAVMSISYPIQAKLLACDTTENNF